MEFYYKNINCKLNHENTNYPARYLPRHRTASAKHKLSFHEEGSVHADQNRIQANIINYQ